MLLSHKHNFLFVHIAKTGGTSVRTALSKYRWGHRYSVPQFIANKMSQLTGHHIGSKFPRHSKIIAAKEMLPDEYFEQLFKFAFVRNPWDLQVSSFHHIKRERPHVMQGKDDFETFLRWKFDPERPYQYHIDTSLELQSDYLVDLHGKVLVDYIGHYENLQDDFRYVCDKVGVSGLALPHKRKATDRAKYLSYYTDETAELVAKHFARDIDILGYTFDPKT
ncbi:sulfotransferase family 2 domain-containing protein [Echinimonas agarilytica]|uniref:Sulfotransferase family protein n=1 Tax=Echinimonas agarilytica TaxID=1215918 RepID=A0AA41W7V7_9GAMM|nr:sulfotransferase family 2 domain-containing protein [Echinimonas agarilytica]MCM2680401.1 sulfotransferase family protein [Echinimonas agarilytica]